MYLMHWGKVCDPPTSRTIRSVQWWRGFCSNQIKWFSNTSHFPSLTGWGRDQQHYKVKWSWILYLQLVKTNFMETAHTRKRKYEVKRSLKSLEQTLYIVELCSLREILEIPWNAHVCFSETSCWYFPVLSLGFYSAACRSCRSCRSCFVLFDQCSGENRLLWEMNPRCSLHTVRTDVSLDFQNKSSGTAGSIRLQSAALIWAFNLKAFNLSVRCVKSQEGCKGQIDNRYLKYAK